MFNNVNIEVNSEIPTITGGIFGRVDKEEYSYIVNSTIRGNHIVGGAIGIYDNMENLGQRWVHGSMFNRVGITPVSTEAYIGGYAGVANVSYLYDKIGINYNDITVDDNYFASTTFVGGIIGKYDNHKEGCLGYLGYNFGDLNVSTAKAGMFFGKASITYADGVVDSCEVPNILFDFYADNKYSTIPMVYEFNIVNNNHTIVPTTYPLIELFGDEGFDYTSKFKILTYSYYIDNYKFPLIAFEDTNHDIQQMQGYIIEYLNNKEK